MSRLVKNIGWGKFFSVNYPSYIELLHEFYATLTIRKPTEEEEGSLRFKPMGVDHKISIDGLNKLLGVSKEGNMLKKYPPEFDPKSLYDIWSLSPEPYNPESSKGNYMKFGMMKYIHRFLTYSFSGRENSSATLNKKEFFILWCMERGYKLTLGYHSCTQFQAVQQAKKPLILGAVITYIVVVIKLLDLANNNLTIEAETVPLSLQTLMSMQLVYEEEPEEYRFVYPGKEAMTIRARPTTMRQPEQTIVQLAESMPR